jgi:MFS family permease
VYLVLSALALVALALLSQLRLPLPLARSQRPATRPMGEILRQPVFLTALAGSSAGFIVMTMVMSSTPLAMQLCGLPLAASATVIQWHMLGMFVPSLFVGDLIRRLGVLTIMGAGAVIVLAQIAVSLSGISYGHFIVGLTLLGLGWNFLFIGGSTLLMQAWRPGEQGKVQAAHDFVVFGLASLGSFGSGALLNSSGWNAVNAVALPLLLLALIMIAIYWRRTSARS